MIYDFNPEFHPLITVDPDTGCWIGKGHDTGKGHTTITAASTKVMGHALFYVAFRGVPPRGTVLHHLCENKPCWNPWHLLPVTAKDHRAKHSAQRASCPQGHAYPENSFHDASGSLRCRVCTHERKRVAKERAKSRRVWVCTCGAVGGREQFPLVRSTTARCESCGRQGGHHIKPK